MVSMCTVSSVSAYDTNMSDSQAQIQQQNSGDSVYGDFQYTVSDGKVTIKKYTGSATTLSIPSTIEGKPVTNIGYRAFYDCSSLKSVTIGNSVTSIGTEAFACCRSLTSVEIPNSVTSIGYEAFYNCSSLINMTIPNSVTSIGIAAFENCSSLTSVTIPNSVTSIGSYAFHKCSSLTNINVNSNNANYSSTNGVLFDKNKTKLICYPEGKTNTSYTIPNSVTYSPNNPAPIKIEETVLK